MVVRIAPVFQYKPHEVWGFPFGYYKTLRDMYIRMATPEKDRDLGGESLTPERLDQLAEEGVTDIDFDAFLAQKRRRQK